MAPTAVLISLTFTHTIISNTTNNNILASPASNSATTLSPVGIYQQTLVGSGGMLIRTLISTTISATSYRKTLIAKLFSHQILTLFTTPSVSFSDLFITTFASYFGINTESTEREVETAAVFIYFTSRICRISALLMFRGTYEGSESCSSPCGS